MKFSVNLLKLKIMRVLIVGATGFIGRELVKELTAAGHMVIGVSRNTANAKKILGNQAEILEWDGKSSASLAGHLAGIEAVINLAGENIAAGRWTAARKKKITESRVKTGQVLTEAIKLAVCKPAVLIQGSAIGYYGTPVDLPAGENQAAGTGFIAELTKNWESSVAATGKMIPRIVFIRTGLVLGKEGGLMGKMLLPFRFYSGTVIGSGRQWMSWIHLTDEVRAIRFLLENDSSTGPYNLTAPDPVRMKDFIGAIAETIGKPAWLKVPEWFLRIALGEMAGETILSSQNIYPGKLLQEGFIFEYPLLGPALKSLLTDK
jgi:hypothetical protein